MDNIKKKVINWFKGNQDFYEGLELLQLVSKKNKVIGKMVKRGDTPTNREKLVWELNKIAGLQTIPKPSAGKTGRGKKDKPEEGDTKKGPGKKKEHLIEGDPGSYPLVIRRLVSEYSEIYKQRGVKHKELGKLPDDNTEDIIKKRAGMMGEIKAASDRMEVLYAAFQEFKKTGKLPEPNTLWPQMGNSKNESVDIEKLKRTKKNLIASLTKDRNMLLYNSKTKPKDGKRDPMPEGAKRIRVEKRIKEKEEKLFDIDIVLAKNE